MVFQKEKSVLFVCPLLDLPLSTIIARFLFSNSNFAIISIPIIVKNLFLINTLIE